MGERTTENNNNQFTNPQRRVLSTLKWSERAFFSGALLASANEGHIQNWSFVYTIIGISIFAGMELLKETLQEVNTKKQNNNRGFRGMNN